MNKRMPWWWWPFHRVAHLLRLNYVREVVWIERGRGAMHGAECIGCGELYGGHPVLTEGEVDEGRLLDFELE